MKRSTQYGYHLQHNCGHGKSILWAMLVTLNLLACTLHAISDPAAELWQRASQATGTRKMLFSTIAIITRSRLFKNWHDLLSNMTNDRPP